MRSLGHRLQELRWGLRQLQALANGEHLLYLFAAPPYQRSILFGSPEGLLGLSKGRRGDRQSAQRHQAQRQDEGVRPPHDGGHGQQRDAGHAQVIA
jgi:hypothetical protein